jgi:four helix bundle protein
VADSYRDLTVWHRAMQMCVLMYRLTATFPPEEANGMSSQLRHSSVAVASNIADGWGRQAQGQYKMFLSAARGFNMEVQTQLTIASELGFGDEEMLKLAEGVSNDVGKMLLSLMGRMA